MACFPESEKQSNRLLKGLATRESCPPYDIYNDLCETEGACCETDGTCNIKPQCECDTDNGAVFAGVGEGCEACAPCGCEGLEGWPPELYLEFGSSANLPIGVDPRSAFQPTQECIDAASDHVAARAAGSTIRMVKDFQRASSGFVYGEGWRYSAEVALDYIVFVDVFCKIVFGQVAYSKYYSDCNESMPGSRNHDALLRFWSLDGVCGLSSPTGVNFPTSSTLYRLSLLGNTVGGVFTLFEVDTSNYSISLTTNPLP